MKRTIVFAVALMLVGSFAAIAEAADFKKQIKARKAVMQVYAFNMSQLAPMVKGKVPYDANAAKNAAGNILGVATMKNGAMWPKGSDNTAPGLADKTRAKPEIWKEFPKVMEASKTLAAAAKKLASEAGNGLDALKANFGPVGKSCGGCHKPFRAPKN